MSTSLPGMSPLDGAQYLTMAVHEIVRDGRDGHAASLLATALLGSEVMRWQSGPEGAPAPETLFHLQARAIRTQQLRDVRPLGMYLWCQEALIADPPEGFAAWAPEGARRALYALPFHVACVGAIYTSAEGDVAGPLGRRAVERARHATMAAGRALGVDASEGVGG